MTDWRDRYDIGDGLGAEPRALPPARPVADALDLGTELLLANTLAALQRVDTDAGSGDLAFIRGLRGMRPGVMPENQRAHLMRLAWRYRLQMPHGLRPAANPDTPAETRTN